MKLYAALGLVIAIGAACVVVSLFLWVLGKIGGRE